jgi:hypothetical protein
MNSTEIIRNYLQAVGQLPKSLNGPDMAGPAKRGPTQKEVEDLRKLVKDQSNTNRAVLFFGLLLILVVFIVAMITAIRSGSSVSAILGVAGIGTGVEAGLLTWVLYLWSEYNRFSFLLILSQRLNPEEFTKATLGLFLEKKSERKHSKRLVAAARG